MKPRITRYKPTRNFMGWEWKCYGGGVLGIGTTPTTAYWDWRGWMGVKVARAARGVEIDQREEA